MSIKNDSYYEMDEEFNEINPEYYYMPPMFRTDGYEDIEEDTDCESRAINPVSDMTQTPITPMNSMMEPALQDQAYTQGFLRTLIGKRVRVSFLIGTQMLTDRVGILKEVGISYIVLKVEGANIDTMADLYSIKFVDIYQ